MRVQSTQDYSDGFWAAQTGKEVPEGVSDAYRLGWEAFHDNDRLFRKAGFSSDHNGGYVVGFCTPPRAASDEEE